MLIRLDFNLNKMISTTIRKKVFTILYKISIRRNSRNKLIIITRLNHQ